MSSATAEILKVCESLSPEKQQEVADFASFLLSRQDSDGDEAWERIINDPNPRPKLEEFLKAAKLEGGAEPMDLNRL